MTCLYICSLVIFIIVSPADGRSVWSSPACPGGFWGGDCLLKCPEHCETCHETSGRCLSCRDGFYGELCTKPCPTCNTSACDFATGHCTSGCPVAHYGDTCDKHCTLNCYRHQCEQDSGHCVHGCVAGFYGEHCDARCPDDCSETCDSRTGKCVVCPAGKYGIQCDRDCPRNCYEGVCDVSDGTCWRGCVEGYTGERCDSGGAVIIGGAAKIVGGGGMLEDDSNSTGLWRYARFYVGFILGSIIFAIIAVALIALFAVRRVNSTEMRLREQKEYNHQMSMIFESHEDMGKANRQGRTVSTYTDSDSLLWREHLKGKTEKKSSSDSVLSHRDATYVVNRVYLTGSGQNADLLAEQQTSLLNKENMEGEQVGKSELKSETTSLLQKQSGEHQSDYLKMEQVDNKSSDLNDAADSGQKDSANLSSEQAESKDREVGQVEVYGLGAMAGIPVLLGSLAEKDSKEEQDYSDKKGSDDTKDDTEAASSEAGKQGDDQDKSNAEKTDQNLHETSSQDGTLGQQDGTNRMDPNKPEKELVTALQQAYVYFTQADSESEEAGMEGQGSQSQLEGTADQTGADSQGTADQTSSAQAPRQLSARQQSLKDMGLEEMGAQLLGLRQSNDGAVDKADDDNDDDDEDPAQRGSSHIRFHSPRPSRHTIQGRSTSRSFRSLRMAHYGNASADQMSIDNLGSTTSHRDVNTEPTSNQSLDQDGKKKKRKRSLKRMFSRSRSGHSNKSQTEQSKSEAEQSQSQAEQQAVVGPSEQRSLGSLPPTGPHKKRSSSSRSRGLLKHLRKGRSSSSKTDSDKDSASSKTDIDKQDGSSNRSGILKTSSSTRRGILRGRLGSGSSVGKQRSSSSQPGIEHHSADQLNLPAGGSQNLGQEKASDGQNPDQTAQAGTSSQSILGRLSRRSSKGARVVSHERIKDLPFRVPRQHKSPYRRIWSGAKWRK